MAITMSGTLTDPMGNPQSGANIRIIALETGAVVKGTEGEILTSETGTYGFNLLWGKFTINILYSDEYTVVEEVDIPESMYGETHTLPTLVLATKIVEPVEPVV